MGGRNSDKTYTASLGIETMAKELAIIIAVIVCIFFWVPINWLFMNWIFSNQLVVFVLPLISLIALLMYSARQVKRLVSTNHKRKAGIFVISLLLVIVVSLIVVALINAYYFSHSTIITPF